MAAETTVDQLQHHRGRDVCLAGWVYNVRSSGKIMFLILRDGTGMCQCVLERTAENEAAFEAARKLKQESSLTVTGRVREEPRAVGGYELAVTHLSVIHEAADYPITPKAHGVEFLMKHRHLWFRSRRQHVILRIRHTLVNAIRQFFNDRGFVLIDTPILAPSAGEGAATLFAVDYFGEPVYLAQTGQLYVEAACMAHRKVYCFGPTFRAEKSKTRRHLTEFWMVEPEVAFADLDDDMALAEDFVCFLVAAVLAAHREDLVFLGRDLSALEKIKPPFRRVSYSEAAELLRGPQARALLEADLKTKTLRVGELRQTIVEKENARSAARKEWEKDKLADDIAALREGLSDLEEDVANIPHHLELAAGFTWGKDLGGSDETIISRLSDVPTFVHCYPRQVKAFYMKRDPDDPRVVKNFDLLAPEGFGEIIGGSQREDDLSALLERLKEEGLPIEPYEWYLDLRRYGSVPHAGFGLGVERTLGWICGLKHVRETIPFPRMMGKIYP